MLGETRQIKTLGIGTASIHSLPFEWGKVRKHAHKPLRKLHYLSPSSYHTNLWGFRPVSFNAPRTMLWKRIIVSAFIVSFYQSLGHALRMESPRFYKKRSYTVIGRRSSTVVFQRGSGGWLSKKDCIKRWRSIGSSNFKLFARFCSGFLWRRYDRQSTKWEGGRIFLACLFDHEEARNVRNVCQIHLSESSQISHSTAWHRCRVGNTDDPTYIHWLWNPK